ncbi:hypothetical protein COT97_02940 [Candidatus Falkowbacteria bacterium CG10_big_fil_rev_8_21_14_0_10_39_11]|uniref:Uncharacterized protein n=1 Tax=Candidatus Falkowbacteria bacterium CG10_big_fil_rev_8_21_14_0_10_39_11 TaxID=1974565 RepID=A0A2H0V4Y1_9BACT|nr:MAG: hypothetical protein COT97_02940 [Candidatus Falkowbacteria bacterium CG10_big_fil_rev_8_21_14_0_10_39_11]
MLEPLHTEPARLGFLLWIIINVGILGFAIPRVKSWALISMIASTIFFSYLLYYQIWITFLWSTLLVSALTVVSPLEKPMYKQKKTGYQIVLSFLFACSIHIGIFRLEVWLNTLNF